MARSRDYKSIRYDSAIDGHCAACSSSNLRQASSNRRSMSRGWLAERTGTTRPRRRRRAVRHMPSTYLTALTNSHTNEPAEARSKSVTGCQPAHSENPVRLFSHGTRDNVIHSSTPLRVQAAPCSHIQVWVFISPPLACGGPYSSSRSCTACCTEGLDAM